MAQWFGPGDALYVPGGLPTGISAAASCVYDGRLWLFGGYADDWGTVLDTVYVYDPLTSEWELHGTLTAPDYFYSRATVIDGVFYMVGNDAAHSYDPAWAYADVIPLPAAGAAYGYDIVAFDGLAYWGLSSLAPEVYDPAADAWTATVANPELSADEPGAQSVAVDGDGIYVVREAALDHYDPSADSWTTLTAPPAATAASYRAAGLLAGAVIIAGGFATDAITDAASYDIATDAWTSIDPLVEARSAVGSGVLYDGLFVAGGETGATLLDSVEFYADAPPPFFVAELDISYRMTWPLESILELTWTTGRLADADAGAVLSLLHTTSTGDEAELFIVHDPVPDEVVSDAPLSMPIDTGTIQEQVGSGVTASLEREGDGHPSAGSVTLATVEALAGDGGWRRRAVHRRTASAPYGRGAQTRDGGVPVHTLTTPNPGDELNEAILPELVRIAVQGKDGWSYEVAGSVGAGAVASLYPLDAPLGFGMASIDDCEAKKRAAEEPYGRQTRMQIAKAAAAHAGVSLIVLGTIPNAHRYVEEDYRTEGQSAASVISAMLFASGPRVWYAPGAIYVDGRTFSGGAGSTDPTSFVPAAALAADGASWQDQPGSSQPEPKLEDYTEDCERTKEGDEEGGDGTFETFESGTYDWTERSGSRRSGGTSMATSGGTDTLPDYEETYHSITKENGRVTDELEETKAYYLTAARKRHFGVVSRSTVKNEHHPVCPEALILREEKTMRRKTYDDLSRFSAEAGQDSSHLPWSYPGQQELLESVPHWFAESGVVVEQEWHAEGWLKSRIETTRELDGMIATANYDLEESLIDYSVTLVYRKEIRKESYIPIGNGLWRTSTIVHSNIRQPIFEPLNPDAQIGEEEYGQLITTGAAMMPTTNTYNVITDQAPPSISCADRCDEDGDPYDKCIEDATEQWEIDHADWAASEAHNAPKRVWNIETNRLYPSVRVGQLLGGGFVAGVTHDSDGVSGRTSIEVWEWLA